MIGGLLLLPAFSAVAQERGSGLEITPFIGYGIGGEFEDDDSETTLELDEAGSYGLIFNWPSKGNTEWEVYLGRQPTEIDVVGAIPSQASFDIDVDYVQLGGTYLFEGNQAIPFFVATIGASRFDPRESGPDTETYFAFSAGGGVKLLPNKRIGFRLEGRLFGTLVDSGTNIFCQGGAGATCSFQTSGTVLWQWQLSAGLIIRL